MAEFAPDVRELLDDRLMPPGKGKPDASVRVRLQRLTPETLFAPAAVKDIDSANACLAALWLRHDFLDEAHAIAQEIDTAEGSWWHAIVHRREADFWNSKYWFRRVGSHPAFATLSDRLVDLGLPIWEPMSFVDQCERAARDGGDLEQMCRRVQCEEWRVLFQYCSEAAT